MARKRVFAVVGLLALGTFLPLVLPPELHGDLALRLLFYLAAALVGLLKDFGRAVHAASAEALPPDAVVLREGPANFKNGWVMVGGVLKLTPDKLVFSAHGFAQKARVYGWELRDFEDAARANTLGLIPNSIVLRFAGADRKFVVTDRERWMSEIRATAAKLRA